jgi:hypothetical protein
MATRHAATDHAERDLASAQLDELALTHEGLPWPAWKQAVLDWHLQQFATARSEAWVPGLAGHHYDPVVEKFLSRYHRHHMRVAIQRLRAENVALRRRIIGAIECTRFYAAGAIDDGERAAELLKSLLSPASPPQPGSGAPPRQVVSGRTPHRHLS